MRQTFIRNINIPLKEQIKEIEKYGVWKFMYPIRLDNNNITNRQAETDPECHLLFIEVEKER
jgi:hypothetical protein